jgi:hypothetical protein
MPCVAWQCGLSLWRAHRAARKQCRFQLPEGERLLPSKCEARRYCKGARAAAAPLHLADVPVPFELRSRHSASAMAMACHTPRVRFRHGSLSPWALPMAGLRCCVSRVRTVPCGALGLCVRMVCLRATSTASRVAWTPAMRHSIACAAQLLPPAASINIEITVTASQHNKLRRAIAS